MTFPVNGLASESHFKASLHPRSASRLPLSSHVTSMKTAQNVQAHKVLHGIVSVLPLGK